MSIITSSESELSTKEILLRTPLPLKTDSYNPVPHKVVIDSILEQLDKSNIKIVKELYTSAKDGRQGMGHYTLAGGDSEMSLQLAFLNSYDKSKPLMIGSGGHVFICGNGMFVAADKFKRKHTGDVLIEFQEEIGMHINKAGELFERMTIDRERMKNIEVTNRVSSELVGRLYIEEALINETQIAIIKRELENPSYDYGVKGTLWNTYNAATVALKTAHPSKFLESHQALHSFVAKEYSFA